MIWPFTPKLPKPPWQYLGWREIHYVDDAGAVVATQTIQFYARGAELEEREFRYCEKGQFDRWASHKFIQQHVVPWSEGGNLWTPISHPSGFLQDWTKERHRFEWKEGRWFKPAKQIKANIVEFPRAQTRAD
jgi:hypothetical protein